MKFKREVTFEAASELEASATVDALHILLNSIKDKKNLIELGKIISKNPQLMEQAIPWLPKLKYMQ